MLGHLSNGLWTVFSAYENNNRRIRPPLPPNLYRSETGEPWRSYLGYSSPKRKHTLITPSSIQAINFSVSIGVQPQVYWLLANCLTVWAHEHVSREWWSYWDCIFLGLCKSQGIWSGEFRHVPMRYKIFSQMLVGSLAKRRLCLGPAGVINCTPLSALSFWVSLFPGTRGYNNEIKRRLLLERKAITNLKWSRSVVSNSLRPHGL